MLETREGTLPTPSKKCIFNYASPGAFGGIVESQCAGWFSFVTGNTTC